MQHEHPNETRDRYRTVSRYVFFGFVAVAAYFLLAEHWAHLAPILPLLIFAACPLMHLFHHHGGHKHGDDESRQSGPPSASDGGAHQH